MNEFKPDYICDNEKCNDLKREMIKEYSDEIKRLSNTIKSMTTDSVLGEGWRDVKALLVSIDDVKKLTEILIECGVFIDGSAAVIGIKEMIKKADKVGEHFSEYNGE